MFQTGHLQVPRWKRFRLGLAKLPSKLKPFCATNVDAINGNRSRRKLWAIFFIGPWCF